MKYTRKWEDESAYAKQASLVRNPRPEDFPELGAKGDRRSKREIVHRELSDNREEKENKLRQNYQDDDNRNYSMHKRSSNRQMSDRRDNDRRDSDRRDGDRRDSDRRDGDRRDGDRRDGDRRDGDRRDGRPHDRYPSETAAIIFYFSSGFRILLMNFCLYRSWQSKRYGRSTKNQR